MIIPPTLLLYCALATAGYLLIANWGLAKYERLLVVRGMWSDYECDDQQEVTLTARVWSLFTQWLLFAALPMGLYSWLYLLLPLEGPRAGIAIALWTVAVGALPLAVMIGERRRIPFVALVFLLFSQLVKLLGTLAIIGILFSL